MGNLRFGLKGFKKLRVKPASTSRLDEEKPLGQPSGRSPLPGQTAPDPSQTAPDPSQTAPDPSQIPEEPEPQHQGEGSGPLVAWLHQTADGPPRKDLAQVVGNLKVRVKGVRKLRAERETMDPGQTPQDPNQLPNVPDSPPTKPLAQVMGNLRFRVKGLKKKRVQAPTTSRLDEEKPLGHPSGRSPFPGQTAPDQGQTAPDPSQTAPDPSQTAPDPSQSAPDPSQTAPDPSQIPEEPADRAPTKDLSRNMRVRVRAPRKKRVKTDTTALTEQEEEKPLGRPSRQNPFRRIKMAWADPKAVITTDAPLNTPEHQDVVIEAEEEGEATAQAEGTGLRPRVNKWLNRRMKEMSTFAARFKCGSCVH
ncbi:probable helicase with zinc finger domain [Gadus morhua]|uniref:probable helicase with zinc finger domain n=1 Tax=Gadus morhua TaxID=8049 RepID=UPI0011B601F6|nr:probable helicase with zinc finger domain [Gadus morhua]